MVCKFGFEKHALGRAVQPALCSRLSPYLSHCFAAWIKRCHDGGQAPVSPLTNLPLEDLALRPNLLARSLIDSLRVAGRLPPP